MAKAPNYSPPALKIPAVSGTNGSNNSNLLAGATLALAPSGLRVPPPIADLFPAPSGNPNGSFAQSAPEATLEQKQIKIYRIPTEDEPLRCLVVASQVWEISRNAINNIQIRENTTNSNIRRKRPRVSQQTNFINLDKNKSTQIVHFNPDIPFVIMMILNNGTSRPTPWRLIDLENITDISDLTEQEKIQILNSHINGTSKGVATLRKEIPLLIGNLTKTSSQGKLVTRRIGDNIQIRFPENSHGDYDTASVWYRSSKRSVNQKLGDLSPGESILFSGDGLYQFTSFYKNSGVTVQSGGEYFQRTSPIRLRKNNRTANTRIVHVGNKSFVPVFTPQNPELISWDFIRIATESQEYELNKTTYSTPSTVTLENFEKAVSLTYFRSSKIGQSVIESNTIEVQRFTDKTLSSVGSIQSVTHFEGTNQWSVEILLSSETWAQFQEGDTRTRKNTRWEQMIADGKFIPYLSVTEYRNEAIEEKALIDLSYAERVSDGSHYFLDSSIATNLSIEYKPQTGRRLLRFNLTLSPSTTSAYVFRLHRFTAGIYECHRSGQDYIKQITTGSEQGKGLIKGVSIWGTEHPSVLTTNIHPARNYKSIDRIHSGSPIAVIVRPSEGTSPVIDESTPWEFTGHRVYKYNPELQSLQNVLFLKIRKGWQNINTADGTDYELRLIYGHAPSIVEGNNNPNAIPMKAEGVAGERIIGVFNSNEDIDILVPLDDSELIKTVEDEIRLDYKIKVIDLQKSQTDTHTIDWSQFPYDPIFYSTVQTAGSNLATLVNQG
jgi:hypothetical protein